MISISELPRSLPHRTADPHAHRQLKTTQHSFSGSVTQHKSRGIFSRRHFVVIEIDTERHEEQIRKMRNEFPFSYAFPRKILYETRDKKERYEDFPIDAEVVVTVELVLSGDQRYHGLPPLINISACPREDDLDLRPNIYD